MEECHLLTKSVRLQEEVESTDDIVGTFATLPCLISEKIDLARKGLTVDSKHCTLPWRQNVKQVLAEEDLKESVLVVRSRKSNGLGCVWSDVG